MDVKDLYATFHTPKGEIALIRTPKMYSPKLVTDNKGIQLPEIKNQFSERTMRIIMSKTKSNFQCRQDSSARDSLFKNQNELFLSKNEILDNQPLI